MFAVNQSKYAIIFKRMGQSPTKTTRFVDKLAIYDQPAAISKLLSETINDNTRYLVLDLDKTVHRGRNLGECLGWEMIATRHFGEEFMSRLQAEDMVGNFAFDWTQPISVLRYLWTGGRVWCFPGLSWLFFGKIGSRLPLVKRLIYRWFGPNPIYHLQNLPRLALLHQMSEFSIDNDS